MPPELSTLIPGLYKEIHRLPGVKAHDKRYKAIKSQPPELRAAIEARQQKIQAIEAIIVEIAIEAQKKTELQLDILKTI